MLYPKDREIRIDKTTDRMVIEWRWKRIQGVGFLFLCAFFVAFFWFMATAPNPKTSVKPDDGYLPLMVLASVYVVPTLAWGLANILNKTSIVASQKTLLMRISPIPWSKSVSVSGHGIQQFFVKSVTGKSVYRSIYVMDVEGHCFHLAFRMPSEFAAHQICHELQDFYGLEDLPVYGQNTQPHQPGPRTQKHR